MPSEVADADMVCEGPCGNAMPRLRCAGSAIFRPYVGYDASPVDEADNYTIAGANVPDTS